MNEMRIPFGVCDIIYDNKTYSNLASEAVFEAVPTRTVLGYGQMQKIYMLEDYVVSLDMALTEENYDTLKLSNPSLTEYGGGFYDNPSNVNYKGKPLLIHPVEAGDSKDYDITIFSAILDPEKPYTRTFGKNADMVSIRFLGQPTKKFDNNVFKSYFFIGGDWQVLTDDVIG